MEPSLKNSAPLRAKRSTLFSGDQYNNNGSPIQRRSHRNSPEAEQQLTPKNPETVNNCQKCNKKFIRLFRKKKVCHGCGVIACSKCFTESCRCLSSSADGTRHPGFNSSIPLSLLDLKSYKNCPSFWECTLAAPTSIFRCRDREVSANLSIGDEAVVNFRTQLTPSMSCTCGSGISQKCFQSTEFHFNMLRNQKISRWTKVSFIMNYLAVGETWLFLSLSGLASTFYGITKIQVRRLQKFRRVNESLDITLRNEDDVMVRIQGSFCWKIYNEEFDGPAPIGSSPPTASVPESDRIMPIELEPTLNELRSYYESYLFMAKNSELKLTEEHLDSPLTEDKVESGFEHSGYTTDSSHAQYLKPIETQQQFSNNSRTAIRLQIGSRKDSQDAKKMAGARQILRIIDLLSKKYPNSGDLLTLLCPLCTKPVRSVLK